MSHQVAFVVIGGVAAGLLGSPMVTFDIDICYARDPENLERLAAALQELHATLRGVDDDVPFLLDAETLRAGDCFTFSTDVGPLDILGTPAGSRGYEDLIAGAVEMDVGGFTIMVTSIDDLIRMKRAAGRPKDLLAIEELEALREEIEGISE
ncbi:MAG TPA: hypothetical protein VI916_07175 [Acidimicrobiia bacterium]|nr:hypothetical protein [Acidimicrobiia bacterium]